VVGGQVFKCSKAGTGCEFGCVAHRLTSDQRKQIHPLPSGYIDPKTNKSLPFSDVYGKKTEPADEKVLPSCNVDKLSGNLPANIKQLFVKQNTRAVVCCCACGKVRPIYSNKVLNAAQTATLVAAVRQSDFTCGDSTFVPDSGDVLVHRYANVLFVHNYEVQLRALTPFCKFGYAT
jgi:hypothetical protein